MIEREVGREDGLLCSSMLKERFSLLSKSLQKLQSRQGRVFGAGSSCSFVRIPDELDEDILAFVATA